MKAVQLTACPSPGCKEKPQPIMCSTCWPKVSSDVRRRIVKAFKTLEGQGIGGVPMSLGPLLTEAVREVQRHG